MRPAIADIKNNRFDSKTVLAQKNKLQEISKFCYINTYISEWESTHYICRVVTGLKFIKHNRIFHLQIQEGELSPRCNIKNGTVRWVPVDDYKITDRQVYNGQDYHTISSDKRAIDLDNLEAENGYVVTGSKLYI